MKWTRVDMRLANAEDAALPTFDYTKLSAINMCPTWGIMRYTMHKAMPGGGRSMALEAGSAMHECFALVRLIQLGLAQNMRDHMRYHGARLFGDARWQSIITGWNEADASITMRNCALECFATSGFTDDPYDKRRTYVNLETALMYYVQRWDSARYPVWVRDAADPTADVGIEIPFAIHMQPHHDNVRLAPFLYTGRVDGLHHTRAGEPTLLIQENKTASRLDEAWRMSFDMSHQVTGYTVAASLFAGENITRGLVLGLAIPLPKYATDGLVIEAVNRPDYMKARWLQWVEYTKGIHDAHKGDILNAPRHTHSCNRYFRPCSMIPFCASDTDEQKDMLTQMVTEEWSPLHEKQGD
jgi:hypothetical protein